MANLVSLEEFKEYKQINSTNKDDRLNGLITTVSQFIKSYCNTTFIDYYDEWKTEYFHSGKVDTFIISREAPIISIQSFSGSVDGGVTYEDFVYQTDYVHDSNNGIIYSLSNLPFLSYGPGLFGLKLVYKGGFEETPDDIKQAALDLVDNYDRMDFTPFKQVGNASVETTLKGIAMRNIPPHISRILDMHRNTAL